MFALLRKPIESAWEFLFGPDIFITYTRRDGEPYARALQAALARRYLVFLDDTGIHGSQSISRRIEREVRRCRLHIILLTPQATDEAAAPWIYREVEMHLQWRKKNAALLAIYFPPHGPRSLPERLLPLGDFKGAFELPGAEKGGSPSQEVLGMIARELPPSEYEARWHAALEAADLSEPGTMPVTALALPPYVGILRAFSAVRQRTRMLQALGLMLLVILVAATGVHMTRQAAERRAALVLTAEQAESQLRFHDAEQVWEEAEGVAPWSRLPYHDRRLRAQQQRLLSPEARVTLPPGWSLAAIGQRGQEWSLLVHRLHDDDTTNGQAAIVDPQGGILRVATHDDFNPRALFREEATYLHCAGRIYRVPVTLSSGSLDPAGTIEAPSYHLASTDPQIELGWKAGKLCVLAGLERPPRVYLLDAHTLAIEKEESLKLPVDLPRADEEPDGSDRFGEALFRISLRPDTLVTAVWKKNTVDTIGTMSWLTDFTPRPGARLFPLPMDQIGQLAIPQLESLTLSPEDKQLFVQVAALNLFGNSLTRVGRDFWFALDTASARPPWLMDSQITALWPLAAHQRHEAYHLNEGHDLRALTFPDFVILDRPSVGVLREVRAGALLAGDNATTLSLAAVTAGEMLIIREGAPVFRAIAPKADGDSSLRLHRVHASESGLWLAAAYEVNSETAPRQVLIWKVGVPESGEAVRSEWPRPMEPGL